MAKRFQWSASRISLQKCELLIYFCACYSYTWDCNWALGPLGQDTSYTVWKRAPSSRSAHWHTRDGGERGLLGSASLCSSPPSPHPSLLLMLNAVFSPSPMGGHSCLAQGEQGAFVYSWGNLFYGIKPSRECFLEWLWYSSPHTGRDCDQPTLILCNFTSFTYLWAVLVSLAWP